jgi:hypothetical protein
LRVPDSILTSCVLDGGWSMLLLVPASVVSSAAALRSAWVVRTSNLRKIANDIHSGGNVEGSVRGEKAYLAALALYGTLQPLIAMVVLAPLIGLLGSLTTLMPLQSQLASTGANQLDPLVRAFHHALIPPFWGVAVAAFSYAVFALLRARIFRAEMEIFQ